jgi:hypothetical protein
MHLLSEMHIRVYNARHIKREAAVIFLGVSHAQADGKRVRRVRPSRNSLYYNSNIGRNGFGLEAMKKMCEE